MVVVCEHASDGVGIAGDCRGVEGRRNCAETGA